MAYCSFIGRYEECVKDTVRPRKLNHRGRRNQLFHLTYLGSPLSNFPNVTLCDVVYRCSGSVGLCGVLWKFPLIFFQLNRGNLSRYNDRTGKRRNVLSSVNHRLLCTMCSAFKFRLSYFYIFVFVPSVFLYLAPRIMYGTACDVWT